MIPRRAVASLTLAAALLAGAAPPRPRSAPAPRAAPTEAAGREPPRAGAPRTMKLDALEVQGRIQKPQAVFVMPRAHLNVGALDHAEPLLPKVTAAVEKDPL